jgi:hypothetical protein
MATQEIFPRPIKLGHPAIAGDPIDDARAEKVRAGPAESARHPNNRCSLLDILPFLAVQPDPIRQDECIAGSPEPDRGNPISIAVPFAAAGRALLQTPSSIEAIEQGAFLMRGLEKVRAEFSLTALAYNLRRVLNIVGLPDLIAALEA